MSRNRQRIGRARALALLAALVPFMLAACGDRHESERCAGSSTCAPVGVAPDGDAGEAGDAGDAGAARAIADASCGDRYGVLWDALEDAELGGARLGYCVLDANGTTGALLFDKEGRLVGTTGTFRSDAPAKGDWLAMFAGDYFACFAGQTVNYACTAD